MIVNGTRFTGVPFMKIHALPTNVGKIAARHRVSNGEKFRLKAHRTDDTGGIPDNSEDRVKDAIAAGVEALAELQYRLYAENKHAVLIIFQAMDAAGKDGTIKHVMSGVNPQSCRVTSFKQPSTTELNHDFLWRCVKELPERGMIGIFNRSYYEETLVVRVHPELLAKQHLPEKPSGDEFWAQRFASIRDFERHLVRSGTVVLKFFLHVSKTEQKRRLLARLDDPKKHWKFSAADLAERARWDDYQSAYEQTIRHTATKDAPWHVIPADNKSYMRYAVIAAILNALQKLDPKFPSVSKKELRELGAARKRLLAEK
jgi:PPK2 family polyphosphate:nucleotide phosphotransferase